MKTLAYFVKLNYCFSHFSQDSLWYEEASLPRTSTNLKIEIPIKDLDGSTLHLFEKGIVLMKWIRKSLNVIEEGKLG